MGRGWRNTTRRCRPGVDFFFFEVEVERGEEVDRVFFFFAPPRPTPGVVIDSSILFLSLLYLHRLGGHLAASFFLDLADLLCVVSKAGNAVLI